MYIHAKQQQAPHSILARLIDMASQLPLLLLVGLLKHKHLNCRKSGNASATCAQH